MKLVDGNAESFEGQDLCSGLRIHLQRLFYLFCVIISLTSGNGVIT